MSENTNNNLQSKLLENILVVDFSQFLSGPLASLKLADFGARVIKIEKPETGDLCRNLYLSDVNINEVNTLFHAINRNKESFAIDLKNKDDLEKIKKIIKKADVMIQNFRPGVIERLGLDYQSIKKINPKIIYASISGYGPRGEWNKLPGQDLLAQAKSGMMWLTGNEGQPPVPVGLAIADQLAGNFIVQGILAALVRRGVSGEGAQVETSLLEALLDFQFEVLTTHLNDPRSKIQKRSKINNAHAYLAAPYGVYKTKDGYLALAMGNVDVLAKIIDCSPLEAMRDKEEWFTKRDEIKTILREHLLTEPTDFWMEKLIKNDIWASKVFDWNDLFASESFKNLAYIQELKFLDGKTMKTTRSPITINGNPIKNSRPAPQIGEHNEKIGKEFNLNS